MNNKELNPLYGKTVELNPDLTIAVVGAAGKMGTRVSNNLNLTDATIYYCEASEKGQEAVRALGREVSDINEVVGDCDVVILAVPDIALGPVSQQVVPLMRTGSILVTLDPAAAYAGLITTREDVALACAHPCHPSVFLEREGDQWNDTFGGISAPQEVVASIEGATDAQRDTAEEVIKAQYAPVIAVHWVTTKQLAQLEPTLVETTGCMIGQFLKDSMDVAINEAGIPEAAVKAIFYGHIYIALTNALRGSNPFSDACLLAMDYGRDSIIKDSWKKIWNDDDLDIVIAKMLKLDKIER